MLQTMQDRMLDRLTQIADAHNFDASVQFAFSNTGSLFLFDRENEVPVPVMEITFSFDRDRWTTRLLVEDNPIPSQVGRTNYFDHHFKYTEKSTIFAALKHALAEWTSNATSLSGDPIIFTAKLTRTYNLEPVEVMISVRNEEEYLVWINGGALDDGSDSAKYYTFRTAMERVKYEITQAFTGGN